VHFHLPPAILAASPWRLRAVAVLLAVLGTVALQALAPRLLRGVEERAGDMVWRYSPIATRSDAVERRFVVVDIDEASLAKLGPWPWPRERLAELSRKLAAFDAGMQVYDVVLPEERPGDAALAAEFARHPVVLSEVFSLDPATPAATGRLQGALKAGAPACGAPLPQATGYIANAPDFASVRGLTAGHITPRIAPDGMVRQLPPLVCFEGRVYPALGLAALLHAAGAEPAWSLERGSGWLDQIGRAHV
jgi:adenylate cyclase